MNLVGDPCRLRYLGFVAAIPVLGWQSWDLTFFLEVPGHLAPSDCLESSELVLERHESLFRIGQSSDWLQSSSKAFRANPPDFLICWDSRVMKFNWLTKSILANHLHAITHCKYQGMSISKPPITEAVLGIIPGPGTKYSLGLSKKGPGWKAYLAARKLSRWITLQFSAASHDFFPFFGCLTFNIFKTINLARNESLPNSKLSAGSVSESDINKRNAMKHDDTNSCQSLRQQFIVFLGLLPQHMNNTWKNVKPRARPLGCFGSLFCRGTSMMDAANLPRSKVDIKVGPNKNSVRKRLTR